jgi:hypothetical protein
MYWRVVTVLPPVPEPVEEPVESDGGGMKEVIDLLTQMVQRQQKLEDLMSGMNMAKADVEEPEEEMTEKPEEKEEKCAKKAETPEKDENVTTIIKANLDRIAKAESRLDAVEAKVDLIMKSTAKPIDQVVIDPAAIQKAEQMNKYNIAKLTQILG